MGIIKKIVNRIAPLYDPADHVQEALAEQVQRELDELPPEIRHLVADQVRPPYHSGSPEQVRTLARQFGGSMG